MKLLVYGAGVLGSLLAARMHEAGHDVALLARGERLAALRRHGLQFAEGDSPVVRRVPVPVVEHPADGYDLIAVLVRAHQLEPSWNRWPDSTATCCSCTRGRPAPSRWAR
jgi:2-dehydropantoate 2-reductase